MYFLLALSFAYVFFVVVCYVVVAVAESFGGGWVVFAVFSSLIYLV